MASRQTQAVSRPLLIILLILIVVLIIVYARNMGGGSAEDEVVPNLPTMPEGFTAPDLPPGGPQPTKGGE